MRLRNVKNKDVILDNSRYIVKDPVNYKGKWNSLFNSNPIHVEIGSGKCGFLKGMALKYPDINFIGVEKSDSVLALGVKNISEDIPNLKFIVYDASKIDEVFSKEVDVLYLNFSDPWPKSRHEKRRLTYEEFLKKYDLIFKDKKRIVLKTDNMGFFEYSLCSLSKYGYRFNRVNLDLQNEENSDNIMTEYEIKFVKKGVNIYLLDAEK